MQNINSIISNYIDDKDKNIYKFFINIVSLVEKYNIYSGKYIINQSGGSIYNAKIKDKIFSFNYYIESLIQAAFGL